MHNHILSALSSPKMSTGQVARYTVAWFRGTIPASIDFLHRDAMAWETLLARLSSNFKSCEALLNERIMPMPRSVRELLTQRY